MNTFSDIAGASFSAPVSYTEVSSPRPHRPALNQQERYGMTDDEYQSYLRGCEDTLNVCNDYLAFYTAHANDSFTL